jgi:hypothetical protein
MQSALRARMLLYLILEIRYLIFCFVLGSYFSYNTLDSDNIFITVVES